MAPYPEWPLEESLARTGLRRFVGHWQERLAQDETAEASERCEPALDVPRRWDCRLKRSPIWGTTSPSSGGAFAAVLRPVRATPASTPTTICVPS